MSRGDMFNVHCVRSKFFEAVGALDGESCVSWRCCGGRWGWFWRWFKWVGLLGTEAARIWGAAKAVEEGAVGYTRTGTCACEPNLLFAADIGSCYCTSIGVDGGPGSHKSVPNAVVSRRRGGVLFLVFFAGCSSQENFYVFFRRGCGNIDGWDEGGGVAIG